MFRRILDFIGLVVDGGVRGIVVPKEGTIPPIEHPKVQIFGVDSRLKISILISLLLVLLAQ